MQEKSKEEKHLEKMIRKTGREIYRLRKTKASKGGLDKHSFRWVLFLLWLEFELYFCCLI